MESTELRALQAPLKDQYRAEPDSAVVTLKAQGTLDDQHIACKVETGRALAIAGLHPASRRHGRGAVLGRHAAGSARRLRRRDLKAVATALEIDLRKGVVKAEGDLDFRGTLGVDKTAPVGFRAIRLSFEVDTDAPQEKVDQLLKLTERYCVVYQTLNHRPELSSTLSRS